VPYLDNILSRVLLLLLVFSVLAYPPKKTQQCAKLEGRIDKVHTEMVLCQCSMMSVLSQKHSFNYIHLRRCISGRKPSKTHVIAGGRYGQRQSASALGPRFSHSACLVPRRPVTGAEILPSPLPTSWRRNQGKGDSSEYQPQ
jgi:hypothetical protein